MLIVLAPYIVLLPHLNTSEAVILSSSKLCFSWKLNYFSQNFPRLEDHYGREREEWIYEPQVEDALLLLFLYLFLCFVLSFRFSHFSNSLKLSKETSLALEILILLHLPAGLCLHTLYMFAFIIGIYVSTRGRKLGIWVQVFLHKTLILHEGLLCPFLQASG